MQKLRFVLSLVIGMLAAGPVLAQQADSAAGDEIYLPEPGPEPPPVDMQHTTVQEKYSDGSIRIERAVVRMSDDAIINHGKYTEYYNNGGKFAEGSYNRGVHDGAWTFWYENGQVCKETIFENGVPNGSWDVFRADGTLLSKKSYRDGARVGTWLLYHDGGKQPKIEVPYRNGKLHGDRRTFYPNGQVRQIIPFVDGQIHGTVVDFDESGAKLQQREFNHGKVDGQQMKWGSTGASSEQDYREGRVVNESAE